MVGRRVTPDELVKKLRDFIDIGGEPWPEMTRELMWEQQDFELLVKMIDTWETDYSRGYDAGYLAGVARPPSP